MVGLLALVAGNWSSAVAIGRVENELTPPQQLPLGGYTARNGAMAKPGGDSLRVRCVKMGNIALVGLEMLTVPESLVAEVHKRLGSEVRLFMVATHTHCAPDSQMLNSRMTVPVPGIAGFQRRWLNWYADKIAETVIAAGQQLGVDSTSEPHFSVRSALVPLARSRRPHGTVSQRVVQVEADGTAVLSVFGAHPTLFDETELQTRGDWPGCWMSLTSGVVATGAIGDASPIPPLTNAPAGEQAKAFANALQRATAHTSARPLGKSLEFVEAPIALPPVVAHPQFAPDYKVTPDLAQMVVTRFAPTSAKVSLLKIGSLAIIGIPGEPTTRVALSLEATAKAHGFRDAVVLSHSNGWIGYILDPADYQLGGYEATLAFHGPNMLGPLNDAVARACEQVELNAP